MTNAWHLSKRKNGLAILSMDLKNEKVNKLTTAIMGQLSSILDTLHTDTELKSLLITSAKENVFIAGADIAEIRDIEDTETATAIAKKGQDILYKLETLPVPSIALIDGACLGGGLELALACDYRIATDNPKTLIGLPEVQLGIIPGFGGTQRLPRLIGLSKSLDLILSGKHLSAKKALSLGVVNAVHPQAFAKDQAIALALSLQNPKIKPKTLPLKFPKKPLLERSFLGRLLISSLAKKALIKKTKGHYPAPLSALRVIKNSITSKGNWGYDLEAEAFGQLAPSAICKNLVQLFYSNDELKRSANPQLANEFTDGIVLGAGFMGGGIAWAMSNANLSVRIKDLSWPSISRAFQTCRDIYNGAVKRKKIQAHELTNAMSKLSGTITSDGLHHGQILIEAIPENLTLKQNTLKDLEAALRKDCIIASNTSSLSITKIAAKLNDPSRCIGLHFFSPVHRMPLVEIIPGKKTSKDCIDKVMALSHRLKKTPILVQDCPGFLVNRILIPYVNEAAYLLDEGLSPYEIDKSAEDFGMPLGPLKLADEVGLDVGIKVSTLLEKGYGKRMAVPALFHKIADLPNTLGKKTKEGMYIYKGKKPKANAKILAIRSKSRHAGLSKDKIRDRLILLMVNEAALCLEEKVVESASQLDMAMIMGTGFPPFRGGLLRYADQEGLGNILARLEQLYAAGHKRFKAAPLIQKLAKSNQRFYQD